MEFADAINEHLELQRRNAAIERLLPLERYRAGLERTASQPPLPQPAAGEPDEQSRPGWPARADAPGHADPWHLWEAPSEFDWGDDRGS